MKYKYKVKNFRVFAENGVKLDIAPITILTGCNSSGKSSFVKSMLMVNKVLNELASNEKLKSGIKLNFTDKPNFILGSFDNIIHRGSNSKEITVEYTVPSVLLNEDVVMSLTFRQMNDSGILSDVTISLLDGSVLFQSKMSNDIDMSYDVTCCQDLRSQFYRYAFAVNNRNVILCTPEENLILQHYTERGDKESLDTIKKQTEGIRPYYYSNKEWIDNILASDMLYSGEEKIELTLEQIYKENMLYCSALEELFEAQKENFENIARSIAEKGKTKDCYELALSFIEKVANEFGSSTYNKFSEYCISLNDECFNKTIEINRTWIRPVEKIVEFYLYNINNIQYFDNLKSLCGKNSLGDLYHLLKLLTGLIESKELKEIYNNKFISCYKAYSDYIDLVIKEILSYRIPTEISYIPTSAVKIKRLYSFEENDNMTKLLKYYLLSKSKSYYNDCKWHFASKWLRKLNVGNKISINTLAENLGCQIRIFQDNDTTGQLLADFGYGISQLIFLLLRIEIEANLKYPICEGTTELDYETDTKKLFRLMYEKPFTIFLEEPEVHLHPKFQSMIADILLDAYKEFNFHFIVETHSEYLIRKSQLLVSGMGFENNTESVEKNPFITYYIPENGEPYSLGYRKDGKFMESFGTGFYDEASNLAFELL